MRLSTLLGTSFLSLALPFFATAQPHGHSHARRHDELAHRARGDVHVYNKRFSGIRMTYYDVGLGACGKWNVASDFIVALSAQNWGDGYPGPQCFKSITISYKGKTHEATIMDECMGCPPNGLDFSRGLFNYFASEDEGVIYGDWWYNDGGEPEPTTTKKPDPPPTTTHKPTTTSTPPPPPTSTWSPPPTSTSTWSPPPSSSSAPPSSSSHSTSSAAPSTSATPSSTSSAAPTPTGPDTLNRLNQAVIGLGAIAVAGGNTANN